MYELKFVEQERWVHGMIVSKSQTKVTSKLGGHEGNLVCGVEGAVSIRDIYCEQKSSRRWSRLY